MINLEESQENTVCTSFCSQPFPLALGGEGGESRSGDDLPYFEVDYTPRVASREISVLGRAQGLQPGLASCGEGSAGHLVPSAIPLVHILALYTYVLS